MTAKSILGFNSPAVTAHVDKSLLATTADITAIKAMVADNAAAKTLISGLITTKRG